MNSNPFEPINARLTNLEGLTLEVLQLLRSHAPATSTDEESPLSVEQAAEFLGIATQTVYQNIKRIPNRKKHGRLYFFKSELLLYLESGKGATAK